LSGKISATAQARHRATVVSAAKLLGKVETELDLDRRQGSFSGRAGNAAGFASMQGLVDGEEVTKLPNCDRQLRRPQQRSGFADAAERQTLELLGGLFFLYRGLRFP
jgi:hypothetical protein